uniref:Uncharacterized protein n=1 Tax=Romanomermis culicivorax TaxID=13658 RepID=A0A915IC00_ROMCU
MNKFHLTRVVNSFYQRFNNYRLHGFGQKEHSYKAPLFFDKNSKSYKREKEIYELRKRTILNTNNNDRLVDVLLAIRPTTASF